MSDLARTARKYPRHITVLFLTSVGLWLAFMTLFGFDMAHFQVNRVTWFVSTVAVVETFIGLTFFAVDKMRPVQTDATEEWVIGVTGHRYATSAPNEISHTPTFVGSVPFIAAARVTTPTRRAPLWSAPTGETAESESDRVVKAYNVGLRAGMRRAKHDGDSA